MGEPKEGKQEEDGLELTPSGPIRLRAPCDDKQTMSIMLRNRRPDGSAIIFKLKCTRPDRFRMQPVFGGPVASADTTTMTLTCLPTGRGAASDDDHVTLLTAPAPANDKRPPTAIWRDDALIPNTRRRVIPIVYEMQQIAPDSEPPLPPPPTPPKEQPSSSNQ